MQSNDNFTYKRFYFVKDLLDASHVFKDTDTIEFATFSSFIKWFVQRRLFDECTINNIIVPIRNTSELSVFKQISFDNLPHTKLYLKDNINKELLSLFDKSFYNVSVLVDDYNVAVFKEALYDIPVEALNYFKYTQGTYRVSIDSSDIDDIVYKITNPFFTLPFFSKVDLDWNFEDLEKNVTIDRLHAIIWHIKFLNINVFSRNNFSKIYWRDFSKQSTKTYSKYRLQVQKQQNIKYFYIDDNKLYFSRKESKLPSFTVDDIINKDGNELDVKEINNLLCIVDQPSNYKYFSNWEQRFRCNKSVMEESYLCRFLNSVLLKGDIS